MSSYLLCRILQPPSNRFSASRPCDGGSHSPSHNGFSTVAPWSRRRSSPVPATSSASSTGRSEERRVGKECRWRGSAESKKKKEIKREIELEVDQQKRR